MGGVGFPSEFAVTTAFVPHVCCTGEAEKYVGDVGGSGFSEARNVSRETFRE